MLVRDQIAQLVNQAIKKAQKHDDLPSFDPPAPDISRPKEAAHGDYTTTIAMQSARLARMAPIKIAQAIVKRLPPADFLGGVEVVPPGFINFRLNDAWLAQQVLAVEATVEAAAGQFGNHRPGSWPALPGRVHQRQPHRAAPYGLGPQRRAG